ncbi:MAG: 50S ribosomal protein L22 [Bacteroidia bacterium]|nr:50S ribosomal protein L22 [Bacteroidia bacterium]
MGARKRLAAEERKEQLKQVAFAKLNNCPTSPRKMRLVADMIRGQRVTWALEALKYSKKEASGRMEKLLISALANWRGKFENERIEDHDLYVSEVEVDSGRQLKRLRPAPQGRGHRIRKRSNHITLIVDSTTPIVFDDAEYDESEEGATEDVEEEEIEEVEESTEDTDETEAK